MLQTTALIAIFAAAAWLAGVAFIMGFAPQRAARGLAAIGSTPAIHFGEHILRGLAGIAVVVRSPFSKAPEIFEVAGWFVLVTSIALMLAPRRWHHAYATWWAERIPLSAYRILAMPTLIGAAALTYFAL